MSEGVTAFVSFEQKWLAAFPENNVLRVFLSPADRVLNAAFACLIFELAQTALHIAETQIAASKLNWWSEELARASAQQARHPITQTLFSDGRARAIAPDFWQALVRGATAQMGIDSSADFASQIEQAQRFSLPLARIERELFFVDGAASESGSTAAASLAACAQLLHQVAVLPQELQQGRLPLPLSLLARHQLNRDNLLIASAQRTAAIRDYLNTLAAEIRAALALGATSSIARRVRARLDLALIQRALRHADPLQALNNAPGASPWRSLWFGWSAARALAFHQRRH
jgi:phytoene synthase